MSEQMTVNASGGKQHFIPYRAQALFFKAIKAVAALRYEGFNKHGYEDENYKQIPIEEHLNHCLIHIINAVTGEDERGRSVKDNWIHALCRLMMIVEIILDEESDDGKQD